MKRYQKKQHHNKIRYFVCRSVIAVSLVSFLWNGYFCPDARYIRDNYIYLAGRMGVIGIPVEKTHFYEPLPVVLYKLHYYAECWTLGYLHAAASVQNNDRSIQANPYDALSRLFLTSLSEDIQAVYDDIGFCAAACNENFLLSENTLALWLSEREPYRIKAIDGCASQSVLCISTLVLALSAGATSCILGILQKRIFN